ncbi:ABC transporter ATP-binding protein [Marinobacter changyiensis]|uniref:ABC transporter ATP-binding protein n=1 Tax=Marinobacter changyiensis TaxID=2604091 RepID=UPI00126498D5|nr:ABC transporter ATP-binding protein [Marinobacter changyiensis]
MVTIEPLSYQYSSRSAPVLDGISLTVADGALFGLLGPNGAGKTTLLSMLTGLLPCQPGTIFVDGQDVAMPGARIAAGLALVPQDYAFYLPLTVGENLRFFAGVQGISKAKIAERVDHCARLTGIQDRLQERAGRLSGGLKRRLNLAIGLLTEPRLLLLDEPTVGIDPHSRHFILETIRDLNQQGTTVIYTSHYMEEVEELCDRVAIMDHGRLLREGPLPELLSAGEGSLENLFLNLTHRQLRD